MKNSRYLIACFMVIALTLVFATPIFAAWGKIGSDIRITDHDGERSDYPSLVWTGTEYGVSWHDARNFNWDIFFARIDANGNKIGLDLSVTNTSQRANNPSLVWTGTEFGISWEDFRDTDIEELYFARIDSSGNKIGIETRITNTAGTSGSPSLVWAGSEYGISWEESLDDEIYFARIDATGNKIGSDVRITNDTAASRRPSLVWTGSEYGLSWDDSRDGNYEIYFARIDASGNKIGSDVRITNDIATSLNPSLVWTGTEYGVAWLDNRNGNTNPEIYFTRIDASGNKISADVRITNDIAASFNPSLVWTGTEYGVSWCDYRDGEREIYFARIDALGNKIGADVRITDYDTIVSVDPSLVWADTEYGVAWWDARETGCGGGCREIYFARIGQLGQGPIPTLSEWGLIILAFMLLVIIAWSMRRQHGRLPGTG